MTPDARLRDMTLAILSKLENRRDLTDFAVAEDIAVSMLSALEVREKDLADATGLLKRFVKYVTEDRAVTPGFTRLTRLVEETEKLLFMQKSAHSYEHRTWCGTKRTSDDMPIGCAWSLAEDGFVYVFCSTSCRDKP